MQEHTTREESAPSGEQKIKAISLTQAVLINGLIIAIAIIIGACIIHGTFDSSNDTKQGSGETKQALSVDIKNVSLSHEPFIGNPEAKVVVAYWSDYQCSYCKKFETGPFQEIIKNYVSTGDVAIVFKDYSFLGPDSTTAGLYDRAVWNLYPEQYFAWREAMFVAQDGVNSGFGDEASVVKLTGTIPGIDAKKVEADVKKNNNAYTKLMEESRSQGLDFGINGTPSFITGTQLIGGYVDYAGFKTHLDKQLKQIKK